MSFSSATFFTKLVIWVMAAIQTQALECPTPAVVANFTADKFLGVWYEIESTPTALEFGGRCVKYNYKSLNNLVLTVDLDMDKPRDGGSITISGMLTREVESSTEAKFNLAFLIPESSKPGIIDISYWVLGTDYTSFAVAWSCKTHYVSSVLIPEYAVWILGRKETMDAKTYINVEKILKRLADYFPRYGLKETIQCSGVNMAAASFLNILLSLILGKAFVLM